MGYADTGVSTRASITASLHFIVSRRAGSDSMPPGPLILVGFILVAACLFDITNGMNDVSGMVAAPLATGTLRPPVARLVVLSGVMCGPFLAQATVARAYASGLVRLPTDPQQVLLALSVLACALTAATLWNLLARWRAWPTSSSHALVGALVGAVMAAQPRWHSVHWGWSELLYYHEPTGVVKVLAALFCSPLLGGFAGWIICRLLHLGLRRAHRRVSRGLKGLQVAALYLQGISYGMNDAQKTMGIIAAAVLIHGQGIGAYALAGIDHVPWWVKLLSVANISIGALIGSGAILRKLGKGVFNLHLTEALAAQAAVTSVVFAGSAVGGPVSSGQVLASAIVGAGSASRGRAVRWSTVAMILKSWFITIPGAGLLAAVLMLLCRPVIG